MSGEGIDLAPDDDKLINSISSYFKQYKHDFELLKSDYARAVSDKIALGVPQISERAGRLINQAESIRVTAGRVKSNSYSKWRQFMKTALLEFIANVRDWKDHVDKALAQLKDGSVSWIDLAGAAETNLALSVSGSGDSRESHLFTRAGKDPGEGVVTSLAKEEEPEPVKKPLTEYSLDFIKVSDIPITAGQLKLLGYLRRSANAILGMRTQAGTELLYIGSITNNLIVPNPYHTVKPVFDTAWGTYFLCTVFMPKSDGLIDDTVDDSRFQVMSKYIYLSYSGVAEEIPAETNSHKFTDKSTFRIGDREEEYPEAGEDFVTDAISQSGQLLWAVEGNVQYLINSDLGTVLGYSASVNLNEDGLVKLNGVPKFFLSRPSLNTIILRDEDSEKEEYVSMKSKLIFERSAPHVFFIGGIVFIGPHGEKTTVSTFVPYEVEFGNTRSLREGNYREFSNGVLFLSDKILFIDSGDYIVQISRKDLEQGIRGVICIDDTLVIMDKVGNV